MRAYTYLFDAIVVESFLCLLFGLILLFLNDPHYAFLFKTAGVSAIVVILMAIAGVRLHLFLRHAEEEDL